MSNDTGMAARIRTALEQAFAPDHLEVIDESEGHRGHAGYREGGESHWRIIISASQINAASRIERHRAVHRALGPAIISQIHALAIEFV